MENKPEDQLSQPERLSGAESTKGEPGKDVSVGRLQEISDYASRRASFCVTAGLLGLGIVLATLLFTFCELRGLSKELVATELEFKVLLVRVAGHAGLAALAVYFGYQLIRLSERLFIPHWFLQADNVEMMHAMLGFKTPLGAVAKLLKAIFPQGLEKKI